MTTDNTEHIDWQQINRLPAFDIYKLVLLSLGRDCYTNVVHPFGCPVIHGDGIQRPEPDADYTDRLIVAIENARYGRLPTTGETACLTTTLTTTKFQFFGPGGFKVHSDEPEVIPGKFDLSAPPFDAQFWIVDTAEFRRFCDLMEWSAPPEFLPLGYKKPTVPHPLSEIPPGAPVELADDAPVPMADAPAKAPAPLPALTTSQIAGCFAGFHGWDAGKWIDNLQSPAPWLRDCRHQAGRQGKPIVESTWWPVQIAVALDKKHVNIKGKLHARFKNQEPLKPWYESLETNLPSDIETLENKR